MDANWRWPSQDGARGEQDEPRIVRPRYMRRNCMARGPCLIAHLPRSERLETQLKPFLCPDETIVTPTCAYSTTDNG